MFLNASFPINPVSLVIFRILACLKLLKTPSPNSFTLGGKMISSISGRLTNLLTKSFVIVLFVLKILLNSAFQSYGTSCFSCQNLLSKSTDAATNCTPTAIPKEEANTLICLSFFLNIFILIIPFHISYLLINL